MIKFSDLINVDNISDQHAFLLWMIYEWPIFLNNYSKVLAYSAYKVGWWTRSIDFLNSSWKSKDDFYFEHLKKLKDFLSNDSDVFLNSDIKNNWYKVDNWKTIQQWVSVLIDFDINTPYSIDKEIYISWLIEKWLIDVSDKYKNIFLSSAMDARWSLDFTWNFFALDIAQRDHPELTKRKINKFNDIIWAVFNYNPRLTQENSHKKNDQFRLKLDYYVWNFWFFIPYKIEYYKFERDKYIIWSKYDFLFLDFKYKDIKLDRKSLDRNLSINDLAIKLKNENISKEDRIKIINEYKINNLISDTDDEIEYSSQNMKETAKKDNSFLCEFDNNHFTFISKANEENYVEAHHLIPFSERKRFDVSVDVVENIVCLCPNCHRKIHLAIDEEKKELLKPLYIRKRNQLQRIWIDITEDELFKFYKIDNTKEQLV